MIKYHGGVRYVQQSKRSSRVREHPDRRQVSTFDPSNIRSSQKTRNLQLGKAGQYSRTPFFLATSFIRSSLSNSVHQTNTDWYPYTTLTKTVYLIPTIAMQTDHPISQFLLYFSRTLAQQSPPSPPSPVVIVIMMQRDTVELLKRIRQLPCRRRNAAIQGYPL